MAPLKATKQMARYTGAGGREHCSRCRFFVIPSGCRRIIGPVSPAGWCKYFSQELVWAFRDQGGGDADIAAITTPPGTTVDFNFLTMATLDPSITFTRASVATNGFYTDAPASSYTTYTAGQPRLLPNGLLIEEARTNQLLNSTAPATQTTGSLPTGSYTCWVIGTGSASVSAGTAVITNAGTVSPGTPRTISVTTAGTVTVTVSGSLNRFQLEGGTFPTSFIPTTGSTLTRPADVATLASIPGRNTPAESSQAEFLVLTAQEANPRIIGNTAASQGFINIQNATLKGASYDNIASILTANTFTIGSVTKVASSWASPNAGRVCLNGGTIATAATQTSGFAAVTSIKFGGDGNVADQMNGYIRHYRYWPRVLTNAEMQQVTT